MTGVDVREIVEMNPYLNVIFITSFITPFIGFYLLQLKQELERNLSIEIAVLHLLAVAVSFLIMGNPTYGLFVSILIYFIWLEGRVGFKEVYRYLRNNKINIKEWLAPIAILVISMVIRFMLMLVSNV